MNTSQHGIDVLLVTDVNKDLCYTYIRPGVTVRWVSFSELVHLLSVVQLLPTPSRQRYIFLFDSD